MKMQIDRNRLIIDDPATIAVVVGALLAVGGIAAALYGLVKHNHPVMAIGIGLLILGTLFVVLARSTHIVLDKSGPSTLSSKTLFSESRTQSFALSEVTTVLLEARENSEAVKDADGTVRDQTKITANLFLVTRTAQRIPIGTATKVVNIGGILGSLITTLPLKQEAEQIAAFIGVPMQASDAVGFGQSTP